MNFSDDKSLSSIDNRHKRISSVPRSLLSKKSQDRSKSKEPESSTGPDLLTEPEIKKMGDLASPKQSAIKVVPEDRSNQGTSAVKSHQSRIEELMPDERYRNGERIGSNLNVICIIRKSTKSVKPRSKPRTTRLSPDMRSGALSQRGSSAAKPKGVFELKRSADLSFSGNQIKRISKSPYVMDAQASKSYDGVWPTTNKWRERSAGKIKRSDPVKNIKKVKS